MVRGTSFPVMSGFSKEFLYWSSQVLGPQCGEHEVDLSGPHPGCCRGKNPVDEPPNSFWGKRIDRDQSCLLVITGVLSQGEPREIQGLWSLLL